MFKVGDQVMFIWKGKRRDHIYSDRIFNSYKAGAFYETKSFEYGTVVGFAYRFKIGKFKFWPDRSKVIVKFKRYSEIVLPAGLLLPYQKRANHCLTRIFL